MSEEIKIIFEPLDFCRVKKINEKGFGFLKSIYYPNDIFFHFSQIKKEDFLDKLNKMKRGDFLLYFTSKLLPDNKRKVDKLWYELKQVPENLIQSFKIKITTEFNTGTINVFDLLFVFNDLKMNGYISEEDLIKILNSQKIKNLPTVILPYLDEEEFEILKKILDFDSISDLEVKPFWFDEFNNKKKNGI